MCITQHMPLHMQPQLPGLFLKLIDAHADFRHSAQHEAFPVLYADIESYKVNPHCSCKHRILAYAQQHPVLVAQHIEHWHASHAHITLLDAHGRIALY